MAGSTVSEPITLNATTMIAPSAIEVNTSRPVISSPASEIITVRPETRIARPAVAAAMSSAAAGAAAAAPLLALAADVEQRVVDADGEADQQHQRAGRAAVGRELGDDAEDAHRGGDRGEAEQQRDEGGDERAEREQQDDDA